MLFDSEGKIRRFESPEEILMDFFNLRLMYYERRRVALLQVGRCVRASMRTIFVHVDIARVRALLDAMRTAPQTCATPILRPQDAEWEHMRASNKMRFISAVNHSTLVISNKCAPPP